MSENLARRLDERPIGDKMRRALLVVGSGESLRAAAKIAGLASHQDVPKAAREIGIKLERTPFGSKSV
jgi:hypothetical protein